MSTELPPDSRRGPSLRILAINDVYTLDNLPRLRTLVEHHRTTHPADRTLVTLAGDFVAPSILSSLDFGKGMVECLRMVGVTHAIFGNHEDDIPVEMMRARIAELGATFLATNVAFEPALPTHDILEIGRVRVGLLGVVMVDASAYRRPPFGGAALVDPVLAARTEAARLVRDERCTCVIPLTHQEIEADRRLAGEPHEGFFPVIVGGHEHIVVLEQVEGTWIEKAASDAVHCAIIDIVWPADAPAPGLPDLPTVTIRMEDTASYPEDAPLRAVVDAHMTAVRDLEDATLMRIAPGIVLSSVGTRARQTSLGTLVASAVRDALGADVSVVNGGGIRGGREYHRRLTYGDLKTEVPFDNEVVVAALPGQVLASAIAASRALAPAESGSFLQVDDHVILDERNVPVEVAGAPFDPARVYRVALVRDLLTGLDHIEPLVAWAAEHPDEVPAPGCGRETKAILVEAFAIALWHAMGGFDAVDTDQDGKVTEADVFAAMSRVTVKPSRLTAQLVVAALDVDHDLSVSRAEGTLRPRS
ncbi:MAG: hypothetical protein JWP97_5463 [Labilithrix sp.]|nr:hypothetical protein [Labilithrix sp.]